MYMTLEADYAVRIVDCLSRSGERIDAKRLAEQAGVTLRFSLKILRKLVGGGIVRSYKGAQGGYELARPAREITLGEVIELVDGPITISRCVGNEYSCPRKQPDDGGSALPCRFHATYMEASEMVRSRLYKEHF